MTTTDGLHIFLIAGEHSGDQLGAKLMAAISQQASQKVEFSGVGGEAMAAQGMHSLFPLSDVAIMGPLAILMRLPKIARRVFQTKRAVIEANPDVLVILDSPEFTHPIAKRVRRSRPDIPIIDYVSPSVWAWRPGRAPKMRSYIDHVLALLPFEPAAHKRLQGPPCSYVGHPLIERANWIKSLKPRDLSKRLGLADDEPVIVVLPGSRPNEVGRLMDPIGRALEVLIDRIGPLQVIIPVVDSVRSMVEEGSRDWPIQPTYIQGETEKYQSFSLARAAITASGTATLELALAGTPMIVAYRVEPLSAIFLRRMIKAQSIVLPNLILEENVFPEFIQEDCTAEHLADALAPLVTGGSERDRQMAALAGLKDRMMLDQGTPSEKAAEIVLEFAKRG